MVPRVRLQQSTVTRAPGSDCTRGRGVGLLRRAPGAPDRLPPTSSDDGSTPLPISFSFSRLSHARAGTIPAYILILIALSFAQYAFDPVIILGPATPVASALGHWGGVMNFLLVVTLASAPPPRLPERLVRRAAPLIGILYLAAIIERALSYRPSRPISRPT